MLGLQGNMSSSKLYRCVACSATFSGLASLLVHHATHTGTQTKDSSPSPTQPPSNLNHILLASKDLSSDDHISSALLPESPSPSFYICDCGEEFQDFSLMLEHKHSHVSEVQLVEPLNNSDASSGGRRTEKVFSRTCHVSFIRPATQSGLIFSPPSTSRSPAGELSTSTDITADKSVKDGIVMVTSPRDQCSPPQDATERQLEYSEEVTDTVEDISVKEETISDFSKEASKCLPKNKNLMKCIVPYKVPSRQGVVPVVLSPRKKAAVNDLSIAQVQQLLSKPGIKTKAPSISRVLESSKKRIVCVTKVLSPVVLLETRQKLMDPGNNCPYERYKCAHCHRVFLNLDRLTEHHFLHKKERIKCCRRCKHLIIGKLPFPDHHLCHRSARKARRASRAFKNKSISAQKLKCLGPVESRNSHGKQLAKDVKDKIVALHKEGQGYKKISTTLKIHRSTVRGVIQRFYKNYTTETQSRSGRPRKMTEQAVLQVYKMVLENSCRSASSIAEWISATSGLTVSRNIIHRTLRQIRECEKYKSSLEELHKKE